MLKFFLKEDFWEDVSGDLEEQFKLDRSRHSQFKAQLLYYYQVINYLRPFALKNFTLIPNFSAMMLKHNFLISWRNLLKNKWFSVINIGGLSLGITVTILIGLWVYDEITFDRFHKNYEEIYQVVANRDFNDNIFTDRNMVFPLATKITEEIPEVKKAVWTTHSNSHKLAVDDLKIEKDGLSVGGPFFELFTWKFKSGNAGDVLANPHSIVLTESLAQSLFGAVNPMGKTIKLDDDTDYQITGILEDLPSNSSLAFEYIIPFDLSNPDVQKQLGVWDNYSWMVYVQYQENVDKSKIDVAISDLMERNTDDQISTYFSFPMEKWHLYNEFNNGINSGGTIRYVRLFTVVAIIILLIACINFMNLSTARSDTRAMEVAVRKTLGSQKKQLVYQFFSESVFITFIAFLISLISVYFLLPSFNLMVNKKLTLDIADPTIWLIAAGLILLTGVLAGSYPALYLSSFQPIKILKGKFQMGKEVIVPRRILVIFQFVASIALISSTLIVYQQIKYVKNRDMGYDPNNLIMIPNNGNLNKNYEALKNSLLQTGYVENMARTRSPITAIWWKSPAPDWPGKNPEVGILFCGLTADEDFTGTLGIKILEGREFSGMPSDTSSVLLNDAAIKAMDFQDAVGQKIKYGNEEYTVIGILDNVIMESPFESVEPLMVYYGAGPGGYINIRLKEQVQPQIALQEMQTAFEKFDPENAFDFTFVDEEYGEKFANEELINKIINIFAAMALFICGLGLAGMASYIIRRRMKEIAVRKVLGASLQDLLFMVSKEFIFLVIIALLFAIPVTHYVTSNWLDNYEYHISVGWSVFFIVGFIILFLTLIIVGLNTIRAASTNPIKWIRSE
ncbi:MAG: ABC transporter permease [Saprospiraceae bacterium]|nr:ABC transporter permease [Saprospiraceae bacterium]